MARFVTVAREADFPRNGRRTLVAAGRALAVFRVAGVYYAVEDVCPHSGGPLAGGPIRGGLLTCPWHGWSFDLATGVCTLIAAAKLKTFPVSVEEGDVRVRLD